MPRPSGHSRRTSRTAKLGLESLEQRDVPAYLPAAPDMSATTTTGPPTSVWVMARDMDGDRVTITRTQPAHGVVTGSDTLLTYTSIAGFVGTDTFYYTADDGVDGSSTGKVTVTVTANPMYSQMMPTPPMTPPPPTTMPPAAPPAGGTGALAGRVWADRNGNDRYDIGEGLSGVYVESDTEPTYPHPLTTTSGLDGTYRVDGLTAAHAYDRYTLPPVTASVPWSESPGSNGRSSPRPLDRRRSPTSGSTRPRPIRRRRPRLRRCCIRPPRAAFPAPALRPCPVLVRPHRRRAAVRRFSPTPRTRCSGSAAPLLPRNILSRRYSGISDQSTRCGLFRSISGKRGRRCATGFGVRGSVAGSRTSPTGLSSRSRWWEMGLGWFTRWAAGRTCDRGGRRTTSR